MTTTPNPAQADDDDERIRRAGLHADQCATMAVWFLLGGLEPGFTAAIDAASTPCGCCPDDVGLATLPAAVLRAVSTRLHGDARRVLDDPHARLDAAQIPTCCAADRAVVGAQVSRLISRIGGLLTDAERDDLRLRCVDGDGDFELRCARAGIMTALGHLTADDRMHSAATQAAMREVYERRGGLTVAAVFSVAGPLVWAHRNDDTDQLAAVLRTELLRVDSLMLDPTAIVGGTS